MKDNNMKREFHFFLLTDYEAEEELLRKRNQQGYKFKSVAVPGIYTFEKCEPEDVIYKLDFNELTATDLAGYQQIYEDYGWEYITQMNDYSYFKKPAKDVKKEAEAEIFSDSESKLDMLNKIFWKKMIPVFLIFLLCGMPLTMQLLENIFTGSFSSIREGVTLLWSPIVLLYLYVFVHCIIGFVRLRKKYMNE